MSTPPVVLKDKNSSSQTYLWNVGQNQSMRNASPQIDSIYSQDSDETFIVSMVESEEIRLMGSASGLRLARSGRFSNDPLQALAEWTVRMFGHVNGNQGEGWVLENDFTGRTLEGVIEEFQMTRNRTEKYQVDYSLGFRVGQGMMPDSGLSEPPASPSDEGTLAGHSLGEMEQYMETKRQQLETHEYVTGGDDDEGLSFEDNEIEAQSGATREIMIQGSIPGDEETRQAFDDAVRNAIGKLDTVTYRSPFPGRELEVIPTSFESTREAGITQLGEYMVELIEGTAGT